MLQTALVSSCPLLHSTPLPKPRDPPPLSVPLRISTCVACGPGQRAPRAWPRRPSTPFFPPNSQERSWPTGARQGIHTRVYSEQGVNVCAVTVGSGTISSILSTLEESTHLFDTTAQRESIINCSRPMEMTRNLRHRTMSQSRLVVEPGLRPRQPGTRACALPGSLVLLLFPDCLLHWWARVQNGNILCMFLLRCAIIRNSHLYFCPIYSNKCLVEFSKLFHAPEYLPSARP